MRKFHVYIVESPKPNDLYFNNFEGESISKALYLSGIDSSHRIATDLKTFKRAFFDGLLKYLNFGKDGSILPPIIHISAHGNEDGIELTSGEVVDWDTLKLLVTPINKAVGGLLLCVSACKGLAAIKMSMTTAVGDQPFGWIIASSDSPEWSETNIAYCTFYHLFSKGKDVNQCVNAMKIASGHDSFSFFSYHVVHDAYLKTLQTQAAQVLQQQIQTVNPQITRMEKLARR